MAGRSARAAALEQVRGWIISRRLRPGDRLAPERELAEAVGVSRTALREAVRILEAEGLLEVRQGSGTFVVRETWDVVGRSLGTLLALGEISLEEVMATRRLVEPDLAALAAQHATQAELDRLQALADQMARVHRDGGPFDEFLRLDEEYHGAIAAISGNRIATQVVIALRWLLREGLASAAFRRDNWKKTDPHAEVQSAIASKDSQRAREAMAVHLDDSLADFLHHLRQERGTSAS